MRDESFWQVPNTEAQKTSGKTSDWQLRSRFVESFLPLRRRNVKSRAEGDGSGGDRKCLTHLQRGLSQIVSSDEITLRLGEEQKSACAHPWKLPT